MEHVFIHEKELYKSWSDFANNQGTQVLRPSRRLICNQPSRGEILHVPKTLIRLHSEMQKSAWANHNRVQQVVRSLPQMSGECDDIPVSIPAGQSAKRHLAKLEVLGLGSIPSAQTITGKRFTRRDYRKLLGHWGSIKTLSQSRVYRRYADSHLLSCILHNQ